jgi:hypothetical protein
VGARDKIGIMTSTLILSKISTIYQYFATLIPTTVSHNIAKLNAFRVVFHNLALDKVEGPYIEFGVAYGNSLKSAIRANKKTSFKILGIPNLERRFLGFDTFEGFQSDDAGDLHDTWDGTLFSSTFVRVSKRFKKKDNVKLFKIDVCSINQSHNAVDFNVNELVTEESVAVVLFDMDLKAPTLEALYWIESKLARGSIVIFDEFFGFAGDESLGESGAFQQFSRAFPELRFREVMRYGTGGVVFQVSSRQAK